MSLPRMRFYAASWGPMNRVELQVNGSSPSRRFSGSQYPVDRWTTGWSNGWAFITPFSIGICIDRAYPVDRWNEYEGVLIIPLSVGPLAR